MNLSYNPVVFDVETGHIDNAAAFAELFRPPKNLKDPEKIQAWKDEQMGKLSLDFDLARIVCLAWTKDGRKLEGGIAQDETEEAALLTRFFAESRDATLVGYNILDFDVPLILRRALYLNVPAPLLSVNRYRHDRIVDLMQVLSYDGKVTYRSLDFYVRRFGLAVPDDPHTGADVQALLSLGDWVNIKRHCAADVIKEWRLAERLGVVETPAD